MLASVSKSPHRPRRVLAALGALSLVATLGAAPAHAATDDTSVTLTSGTASMSAPTFADFGSVALDGTRKTAATAASSWSVTDARGTGAGWEVTMAATVPSTGGATPVTLPTAALTLTAPAVAPADAQNSSTPPAVAGGDLVGSTVKVADANTDEGLGIWDFTQDADDLALTVPSDARTGTYTSTITTTFSPGV